MTRTLLLARFIPVVLLLLALPVTPASAGRQTGAVSPRPPRLPTGPLVTWSTSATGFRGQPGLRVSVVCPPGGTSGSVWGAGPYTDDSSVCTAAVHAGVITLAQGGAVALEIQPGLGAYAGSTRNGITTYAWGQWQGSFLVTAGVRGAVTGPGPTGPTPVQWSTTAEAFRGQVGQRFRVICPPCGTAGSIWGTGTYTDDSSVCTAAVHAGRVNLTAGGTVTIEIQPGLAAYTGSTMNGIATSAWGTWHGSFVVVSAQIGIALPPVSPVAVPRAITWTDTARSLGLGAGGRLTVICPPLGSPGIVWGTDVYTDDSSVCTAAVHSGALTLTRGGAVVIEGRAGEPAYSGTTRGGITTQPYGPWSGSFVLAGGRGSRP